jgi:hypothetical protein
MSTGTTTLGGGLHPPVKEGLLSSIRFAVKQPGVVLIAPQVAFLGAYVLVYGVALWTTAGRLGGDALAVILAVVAGLISVIVGLTVGWRRWGTSAMLESMTEPIVRRWIVIYAFGIVAIGLVALGLYFLRIGQLPLFMETAEQARVDAAEIGGAPLRVLALLALPGSWLLVSMAARTRRIVSLLAAAGLILFVAAVWLLTANRAPSFMAVEVGAVLGLSAWGITRISWRITAVLLALAIAAVVAAGAIGALRIASTPAQGPPAPGQTTVPRPPTNFPALVVVAIRGYAQVPIENMRSTMVAVPERIGWRLGMTYLQPIITALPGRQTTFDADLKAALGQRYRGGGTVPGLLGESYANFGPLGWAVVPGLIAFGLVWLFALARRQNTVSAWALYSFAIVHAANATISGVIVASPFPYVAMLVLGGANLLERRHGRVSSGA